MTHPARKTRFYIDGFNLYYGALKNTPYKWLNLAEMARKLTPNEDVTLINYFTAKVSDRPKHEGTAARQDVYFRALTTCNIPIDVTLGQFQAKAKRQWVADDQICKATGLAHSSGNTCACCARNTVNVIRTEEKGSDVNLSVGLVRDAAFDLFELAVVVSNDSDMQSAVDIVLNDFNRPVFVVNPRRQADSLRGSRQLKIYPSTLKNSQFQNRLILPDGQILTKPSAW